MAANRRLLAYWQAPEYRQTVIENMHKNVGDYNPPVSRSTIVPNTPHRRNLSFLVGSVPRQWQEFTTPKDRKMLTYRTPKGDIIPKTIPGQPTSTEQYTLRRRMYIYNHQVVVE